MWKLSCYDEFEENFLLMTTAAMKEFLYDILFVRDNEKYNTCVEIIGAGNPSKAINMLYVTLSKEWRNYEQIFADACEKHGFLIFIEREKINSINRFSKYIGEDEEQLIDDSVSWQNQ